VHAEVMNGADHDFCDQCADAASTSLVRIEVNDDVLTALLHARPLSCGVAYLHGTCLLCPQGERRAGAY